MMYHVMFPDFSGFQIEMPRHRAASDSRKQGTGGCMRAACTDLWPEATALDATPELGTSRMTVGGPPR